MDEKELNAIRKLLMVLNDAADAGVIIVKAEESGKNLIFVTGAEVDSEYYYQTETMCITRI